MKRIPQGKYSKEFREKAEKHIIKRKLSIPEASQHLYVPKSTISYWVRASKAGNRDGIKLKLVIRSAHKHTRETCCPERLQ